MGICSGIPAGGSSLNSGGVTCHDAQTREWACDLLRWERAGRISIANRHPSGRHDNAYPIQNIRDTCAGRAAARSRYVVTAHSTALYPIQFNEVLTFTFRASCYSTRLSWAHTPVINWIVYLGQTVSS